MMKSQSFINILYLQHICHNFIFQNSDNNFKIMTYEQLKKQKERENERSIDLNILVNMIKQTNFNTVCFVTYV